MRSASTTFIRLQFDPIALHPAVHGNDAKCEFVESASNPHEVYITQGTSLRDGLYAIADRAISVAHPAAYRSLTRTDAPHCIAETVSTTSAPDRRPRSKVPSSTASVSKRLAMRPAELANDALTYCPSGLSP